MAGCKYSPHPGGGDAGKGKSSWSAADVARLAEIRHIAQCAAQIIGVTPPTKVSGEKSAPVTGEE
jgi:hypothetical protein